MSKPVLYDATLDLECFTVRLLFNALSLDYQRVAVDVFPAQDEVSRQHLSLSATGQLPILQVAGETLNGAEASVQFIAANLDPDRRFIAEAEDQDTVASWLRFLDSELVVIAEARRDALLRTGPTKAQLRQSRNVLLFMEDELCTRQLQRLDWFAANKPTLADISMYPHVALMRDLGLQPDEFPVLRQWLRRVRNLAPTESMPGIPDMR